VGRKKIENTHKKVAKRETDKNKEIPQIWYQQAVDITEGPVSAAVGKIQDEKIT
jgi:hypothetical protein